MKKILVPALLCALLSLSAFGQKTDEQPVLNKTEQQVIALNRQFAGALLKRDTSVLENILAGEYIDTDIALGTTKSKRQVIDECRSNPNPQPGAAGSWESFDITDPVVSVHGNTAVVTGRQVIKGQTPGGQSFTSQSFVTTVFIRQQGRWRIVATHGSRLDAPRQESTAGIL